MRNFITYFLILNSTLTSAFTLNESEGRGFPNNKIDVHIASTDCSGAGFSTQELKSMVTNAVDDYWNSVATSALKLNVTDVKPEYDIDGLTHTEAINTLVPENSIIAGCNDDVPDYSNPSILGSAVISCNGSFCKSVLILNANNSSLNSYSTSDIEAVIAHELGHAIGLGHTDSSFNLMYYSVGDKNQKWLGQDDVDGVTYLYPHDKQLMGCLGNMGGTIKLDTDKVDWQYGYTFLLSLCLSLIMGFTPITYRKIINKMGL